jgi:hypothetical protein
VRRLGNGSETRIPAEKAPRRQRIARITTVCLRVGQRPDHAGELGEGARPTMAEQQRQRPRTTARYMDRMDPHTVEKDAHLRLIGPYT